MQSIKTEIAIKAQTVFEVTFAMKKQAFWKSQYKSLMVKFKHEAG